MGPRRSDLLRIIRALGTSAVVLRRDNPKEAAARMRLADEAERQMWSDREEPERFDEATGPMEDDR